MSEKYEIYFKGYTKPPFNDEQPCFMEERMQYPLTRAQALCDAWNRGAVLDGYIRKGETCYEPRINPLPLPTEEVRQSASTRFAEDATLSRNAELERENAELRTRLEIDPEHGVDGIEARDETIRLQDGVIAELRKDAERIDWMAAHPLAALDIFGDIKRGEERFVRKIIDAAIASEKENERG